MAGRTAKKAGVRKEKIRKTPAHQKPTNGKDAFIIAILVAIAVVLYFFITGGFGGQIPARHIQQNETAQEPASVPELSGEYASTLPAMGNQAAQISLTEFGDFQCPFCRQFYTEAEERIIAEYINTGKVRFYYKDFPRIGLHDKAMLAANAARCADAQGKFWEMHNIIYENQKSWSTLNVETTKDKFREYANSIGLNISTFSSCVESQKYQDRINSDIQDGRELGMISTPAFLVYIPKNKVSFGDIRALKTAIKAALFQQEDYYILFIEGNRNYEVFRAIFDSGNAY